MMGTPTSEYEMVYELERGIDPGTHEQRTTLASQYVNWFDVAVWVRIGDLEYGFVELPNAGTMTVQEVYYDGMVY